MGRGRRRLGITLTALLVGLVATDVAAGFLLVEGGHFGGRSLPPFGTLDGPKHRETLRREVARERAGKGTGVHAWDAELGWDYRPGEWTDGALTYHINGLGARGRGEHARKPAPGSRRVVCFGDSYTFGTEVDEGQDWPAVLDARLAGVEVLNFGVGGYGLDQSLLRFERLGTDLGAEVLLAGIQLQGIRRNVNRYVPFLQPTAMLPTAKPRFLHRDGRLELLPIPYASRLELLEAALEGRAREELSPWDYWAGDDPWLRASTICRIVAGRRAWARRETFAVWRAGTREPVNLTVLLVEELVRRAQASGVREVVVVVFPSYGDVHYFDDSGGRRYWEPLCRALEARRVRYIDLAVSLGREDDLDELYTASRRHLSPAGNACVARTVGDVLERLLEVRDR